MSCTTPKTDWKTIEVGGYLLDVPQDFTFKHVYGIDSEGGEIGNGAIKFNTNFGYYTDTLFQTPDEYINKRWFLIDAKSQFMKPGIVYDAKNSPKIDLIAIRPSTVCDSDKAGFFGGSDYIATCSHDGKIFKWPVKLPVEIKRHIITIDTFNQLYRRIAVPKKNYLGTTGIYVRYEKDFEASRNAYYAIVIAADSLSASQQKLALKIFKTLRRGSTLRRP